LQNVLKKIIRLTQITSGFYVSDNVYDDDGTLIKPKETHRFDPNAKLEVLIDFAKTLPSTSKAIISACWQQDIRTISARLALEGMSYVQYYGPISAKQREHNLHLFNTSREPQFLVGNPATFGIGLNILGQADDETNCDHILNFSQGYSSPIIEQLRYRNNRIGTRVPTQFIDFVIYGTYDSECRETVWGKQTQQLNVSNVRKLLAQISAGLDHIRDTQE
jgi:hypothetical protein